MSNARRVQQQIQGVIAASSFSYREDGDSLQVLAPKVDGANQSTLVRIHSEDWPDDRVVVHLSALVLGEIPEDDTEAWSKAFVICNGLNQDLIFGRWVVYPEAGMILLEHELVGQTLDDPEILGAVATMGAMADQWDDRLLQELGVGRRLFEGNGEADSD